MAKDIEKETAWLKDAVEQFAYELENGDINIMSRDADLADKMAMLRVHLEERSVHEVAER